MTKKSYRLATLGCKANFYDSQLLEAELRKRGWVAGSGNSGEAVDLCIVNSCTVTDEADRQTRKMAARLFRDNPNARVVVTGCGAEIDPERLASSRGVHYVIGNRDKPLLVDLILKQLENPLPETEAGIVLGTAHGYDELLSRHPIDREWPIAESAFATPPVHLDGHSGKTRAFLKIQEGCNSFCTYCIIPYGRGPSRSLRPGEVVAQVRELVSQGIREVVITGTNVGDYGSDWGADLSALTELFEMILSETGLERLRVSSLDPAEITPDLVALMEKDSRFCPHFHVSLQSADSKILRLMKRKYSQEKVESCLRRIAEIPAPLGGVFVGMDVITGFPGETDEDFEGAFATLEALPWSRLHVFPYSERNGTPATRLPGSVPQSKRVERAQRLNRLSLDRLARIHEDVLKQAQESGAPLRGVLLEKPVRVDGEPRAAGYTSNYLRVIFEGDASRFDRNALIDAIPTRLRIDSASGDVALWARPVPPT